MKKEIDVIKRDLKGVKLYREFDFLNDYTIKSRGIIDEENMIVEMAISSETPCKRDYGYEILSHEPGAINMSRLLNKAQVLQNHLLEKVNGVIENARIVEKRIFVEARWSDNPEPQLVYNDIKKKIQSKTSVGYTVEDMIELDYQIDGYRVFKVIKWTPLEASIVGIAFDDKGTGVGRSLEPIDYNQEKTAKAKELEAQGKADKSKSNQQGADEEKNKNLIEVRKMDDLEKLKLENQQVKKELEELKTNNTLKQRNIEEIEKMGEMYHCPEKALQAIKAGRHFSEFSSELLAEFRKNPQAFVAKQGTKTDLGLDEKEVRKYDFFKAVDALANKDLSKAGYEKELSDAYAKKIGKESRGLYIIPEIVNSRFLDDSKKRAMTAGSNADGGYSIATNLLANSFIDVLRIRPIISQLGATVLSGLVGDIVIPRKVSASTIQALIENDSADETSMILDQVAMSPKSLSGNTLMSRKLRQQSSLDIQSFSQMDLIDSLMVKLDNLSFNGSGSDGEPLGVRNQTGINAVITTTTGQAPTWAMMVDMESAILDDNVDGLLKYVANSKTIGALKKTVKETGYPEYLMSKGQVNDIDLLRSNNLPSNISQGGSDPIRSTMLLGKWSDLLLGYWGGLDMIVDPFSYSSDGQVQITVFQDYDVAVRHPESFCELSGLIA